MGDVVTAAEAANTARGVSEIGSFVTRPPNAGRGGRGGPALSAEDQDLMTRGETTFNEICFSCHGPDGRGQPVDGAPAGTTMAPPLAGSPRVQGHRDYVIGALLHGLTGPVDGKTYTQIMLPMGATNTDAWVAAIASYVRNSFGNTGTFVTPADVARVRALTAARKTSWTTADLEASLPSLIEAQPTWKATASHNAAGAPGALSLAGWTTAAPQVPGMWVQVELPAPERLAELQFDSPGAGRGFGVGSLGGSTSGPGGGNATAAAAGGGGRRGRGAAAPAPTEPPGLYPRAYRVQVSMDGTHWSAPVAQGTGTPGAMAIAFKPVQAKFVRLTETATSDAVWSMTNLRVYVAAK